MTHSDSGISTGNLKGHLRHEQTVGHIAIRLTQRAAAILEQITSHCCLLGPMLLEFERFQVVENTHWIYSLDFFDVGEGSGLGEWV